MVPTTSIKFSFQLPYAGFAAEVEVTTAQQAPEDGDGIVAAVSVWLPCPTGSVFICPSIQFGYRVALVSGNLVPNWGYEHRSADRVGRRRVAKIPDVHKTHDAAGSAGCAFARLELAKLVVALEARHQALVEA